MANSVCCVSNACLLQPRCVPHGETSRRAGCRRLEFSSNSHRFLTSSAVPHSLPDIMGCGGMQPVPGAARPKSNVRKTLDTTMKLELQEDNHETDRFLLRYQSVHIASDPHRLARATGRSHTAWAHANKIGLVELRTGETGTAPVRNLCRPQNALLFLIRTAVIARMKSILACAIPQNHRGRHSS
jgi:hypothetical protein